MSKMATENENKKLRILCKLHNNLPWFGNLIKFLLNRCCFGEESIIMNEKKIGISVVWGTSHTSLSDKIAGNYEQCPLIMCITNLLKQLSIVKSNPNNGLPSLAVNFL